MTPGETSSTPTASSGTEPVYLIDGFGLIFRAYYAFIRTPMRSREGMNTSAIFGFFRVLASFIKNYHPHVLAVALESRGPTFRDKLFPEYKATRQATPEDLVEQFPWIEKILLALGLPLLRAEGYEADDVMATLSRRCRELGRPCVIVSADKDMLQLVGEGISVLKPAREGGFEAVGPGEVFDNKGVRPDQILDYLSLLGDTADNVPGVKGIGEKTAAKLLADYGTLEGIYENLDKIGGASQKKLAQGRDIAFFSRDLIRLCQEVPLPGLETPEFWTPFMVRDFNGKAAAEILKTLDIRGLAVELGAWGGSAAGGDSGAGEFAPSGDSGDASAPEAAPAKKSRVFSSSPVASASSVPEHDTGHGTGTEDAPKEYQVYDAARQKFALVQTLDGVKDWVARALAAGCAAVDTETTGLDPHTDLLCGVSLSFASGEGAYLALRGPQGNVMDPGLFVEAVRPLFETPGMKLVGQNLKFDWQVLYAQGIRPVEPWFDTMVASWVLDAADGSYGMDYLAERYLGYTPITFESLFEGLDLSGPGIAGEIPQAGTGGGLFDFGFDAPKGAAGATGASSGRGIGPESPVSRPESLPDGAGPQDPSQEEGEEAAAKSSKTGKDKAAKAPKLPKGELKFSRVPLDRAGIYSAEDAEVTWRLFEVFEPRIRTEGFEDLFYRLEMPLVGILARMEWEGMALKPEALREYSAELDLRIRQCEEDVYRLVGHPFNLGSPKQLQEVLFVERKLQGTKRTKTGYSTDTSVLEDLAAEDPVPAKILEFRGLSKIKSTYADALPLMVNPVTKRVHTSLVQTGTATGRLSSRDPNLQNIPIKDEDGRRIRSAFVAPEGTVLVSADYAQIELVLLAHFAKDPGLIAAFRAGTDVHRATAALIFGVEPDLVKPEQRRAAKTINFGVMYGMSAYRLAGELGIPMKQAQAFIDAYFATYSGIKAFMEAMVEQARTTGGVKTLFGRYRAIPDIQSRNANIRQAAERIAVNTPIQGSGADIVKAAMIQVDRCLREGGFQARLILQVHDELIVESPVEEAARVMELLEREMVRVASLEVPLRVSVESGANWGSMHE